VAISSDGMVGAVAASLADSPGNNSGEVRVYSLP
jgi:hypothetical protein